MCGNTSWWQAYRRPALQQHLVASESLRCAVPCAVRRARAGLGPSFRFLLLPPRRKLEAPRQCHCLPLSTTAEDEGHLTDLAVHWF